MYRVSSVALAIGLWSFGIPALQAAGQQCCSIDSHARHEAKEDCDRQYRAYDRALLEAEEAREHARDKAAKAEDLKDNMCCAGETVAEAQPKSETEIIRTKPAEASQFVGTTANIFGMTVADIYDSGVIVSDVNLGSPAGDLGIRRGDVILAVNGERILSTNDFQRMVNQLRDRPISMTINRFGQVNVFMMDRR